MLVTNLSLALVFAFGGVHHNSKAEGGYDLVDTLCAYCEEVLTNCYVDEAFLPQLFTEDFTMVVNGKTVAEGLEGLLQRFEWALSLSDQSADFILLHKELSEDSFTLQYTIVRPGLSVSHVMAIFTLRGGRISQMDAVVHREPV